MIGLSDKFAAKMEMALLMRKREAVKGIARAVGRCRRLPPICDVIKFLAVSKQSAWVP
jgi:hypothetical protein